MAAKSKRRGTRRNVQKKPMLFSALNYRLIGLGCLLVLTGFTGMYLENEVYGFISLYIAPVLILSGYMTVIFGILVRRDSDKGLEPGS